MVDLSFSVCCMRLLVSSRRLFISAVCCFMLSISAVCCLRYSISAVWFRSICIDHFRYVDVNVGAMTSRTVNTSVRLEFPCAIIPSLSPMLINKTENVKETLCRRRIFKTDVKTLLELKKMTCSYVSLQKIAFSSEIFKQFCMICMKMFDLFSFLDFSKTLVEHKTSEINC